MPAPGPLALGRGVVVRAGGPVPDAWDGAPVVRVDAGTLDDPATAVTALHDAWLARSPVVVELAVDPATFRAPAVLGRTSRGRLGAAVRAVARPAPLPRLGQHLRRPGRASRCGGGAARRERLGAAPDGGPAGRATSSCPTAGRRGSTAVPAAAFGGDRRRGRRPHRLRRARPARPSSPRRRAPTRRPGARPAGRGRPRGRTGPGRSPRPGSGKTRVLTERLRHLVVDRRLRAGDACWPWPTTSGPSRRWRTARPTSGPASRRSTRSATRC